MIVDLMAIFAFIACMGLLIISNRLERELTQLRHDLEKLSLDFVDHELAQQVDQFK